MLTKITPRLTTVKQPIRAKLQKASIAGLAVLAGSSMSGGNIPNFKPTEMVIPGGLDIKEKAYYFLTGKMPKSVMQRWVQNSDEYIASAGDEVVTVNIGDGIYVGKILDKPHDYLFSENGDSLVDGMGDDSDTPFDFDGDFDGDIDILG